MNEIIQISALSESSEIQIIYIWYINHVFFNNIFNFNYLLREEVLLSYYRLNIMQLNVSDSIMPDSEHEQDLKYNLMSAESGRSSLKWLPRVEILK